MSLIAKLPVVLEPDPCDEISNSIREAKKLAGRLRGLVVVEFNGILLRVSATTDLVAVVNQYHKRLGRKVATVRKLRWEVRITQGQGPLVVSRHKTKQRAELAASRLRGEGSVGVFPIVAVRRKS